MYNVMSASGSCMVCVWGGVGGCGGCGGYGGCMEGCVFVCLCVRARRRLQCVKAGAGSGQAQFGARVRVDLSNTPEWTRPRAYIVGKVKKLRNQHIRNLVVDLAAQQEDAVFEQLRNHVHLILSL